MINAIAKGYLIYNTATRVQCHTLGIPSAYPIQKSSSETSLPDWEKVVTQAGLSADRVKVLDNESAYFFHAIGNTLFPFSPAQILVDPEIIKIDGDAARFWCCHRLCYLKANGPLLISGTKLAITVAGAFFCSTLPAFLITAIGIVYLAEGVLYSIGEMIASRNALSLVSLEELKGGARFYQAYMEFFKEKSPSETMQLRSPKSLNYVDLFDVARGLKFHTRVKQALKERYKYSETQIQQFYQEVLADKRTADLKEYMKAKITKFGNSTRP